jgi:peptidoglycan hydrolase-like protein with peptidoglycan-binding domain
VFAAWQPLINRDFVRGNISLTSRRAKWPLNTISWKDRTLAKRKKTQVKGIVEDRLRTSTLVSGLMVTGLTGMILYNLFVAQSGVMQRQAVPEGLSTKVSVAAPGKTSKIVTIRYDELVEDVQQQLLALGHFVGMVDGVNGPMTRDAVIRYQRDQQLEQTGEVSTQLLEHIHYTRKLAMAAEFTGSVKPTEVAPLTELPKAKKTAPTKAVVESTPSVDQKILSVQRRLARLGFDPGVRSGELDDATKSAILTFEMEHGLAMQGAISRPFLASLKDAEVRAGLEN